MSRGQSCCMKWVLSFFPSRYYVWGCRCQGRNTSGSPWPPPTLALPFTHLVIPMVQGWRRGRHTTQANTEAHPLFNQHHEAASWSVGDERTLIKATVLVWPHYLWVRQQTTNFLESQVPHMQNGNNHTYGCGGSEFNWWKKVPTKGYNGEGNSCWKTESKWVIENEGGKQPVE